MTIAILCPTRDRPEQFKRMCRSVKSTTEENSVTVCASTNGLPKYVNHTFPIDCPTVHMWNMLAKIVFESSEVKLFMLGADDTIFATPGWDTALLDHYAQLEDKIHVYALKDSRDAQGTPHPIVTREYINAMGYFLPPLFMHWFVDTWTVEIAKANNIFTHLTDYELIHDKPSDKGRADETHNQIRRKGWHERDKYVNDTCQHLLEFEKKRLNALMKIS